MNDPIRFLDSANDAMPFERSLLQAGREIEPPAGAKDKIWAALGPQIGPDGGSGGGGDGGASSGNSIGQGSSALKTSGASLTGSVGGAKIIALGIAGISAIAGVVAAVVGLSSPAPVSSKVAQPPPIVAISAPEIKEPIAPEVQKEPRVIEAPPAPEAVLPLPTNSVRKEAALTTSARVSPAKPAEEKPAVEEASGEHQERASRLREENQMLGAARAALRSGDPASALEKLDAAGNRFPEGVLAQEREVLAIEALAKSGQRAAASARASAFLAAHPTSAHATKVRSFVQ